MNLAFAAKKPLPQAEAIRRATEKAVHARNLYADQVAVDLGASLGDAAKDVRQALLHYKTLGSLPDNKLAALKGLEKLQAEIRGILSTLKKEQTLRIRQSSKAAFKKGIYQGIGEFVDAQLPFYRDLAPDGIEKLGTKVFTLVDTQGLDFLTNYNLVLLGDVHRELSDGIKRALLSGITTGKGVEDIVRDLGQVVKDPESFRFAGKKVFSNAQRRMEVIARTEVVRAHNQGRIKFHREVGVQKLEWMTMEDERVCPVCGPLDGKTFPTDKFPPIPRHPQCRCQSLPAWPLAVCGGVLGAVASIEEIPPGPTCLLPPQAIDQNAAAKAAEDKKVGAAFESGDPAQLGGLTVKQLQDLAKKNGVSIARTKADHLKLLDAAEPGIDHTGLGGEALAAKLKQHGIGALRTKDDLVALLAQKQAALVQAQQIAEQLAKVPASGGLHDLTVSELQEMAKAKGIPISLTKQDVVDLLDEVEPGIVHSELSGPALAEAKSKLGLTPLKNKKQLVQAIEKVAGHDLAEKVKQEAFDAAEKAAIESAKATLEEASGAVIVPPTPAGYADFLASVKKAEDAIAAGGQLPQAILEEHAKTLALKKKLFADQVAAAKQSDLKDLAKVTKLKQWQWANKDELVTLFTETDPTKIEAAKAAIEEKHKIWYAKYGGGKKAAKPAVSPETPSIPPAPNPLPAPPPALVAPVATPSAPASPSVFSRKGSEFDAVDEAWKETGKPSRFKFLEVAKIEGAHRKEFWVDEKGEKWLFKPVQRAGESFRAHGDEVAYRIGRLIDPEAIEVRVITLNGKIGSIQKWRTDLASQFDFRDIAPEGLSPLEVGQLQREHVIDWLISNHDAHPKQFLRTTDGRVLGIDKGQLFKYLGSDRLDLAYHPNGVCGEKEPFYNTLFRAAQQGKVPFDPAATLEAIRQVERIPDDDYLAILRPYANGRFGTNESAKKTFLDQALARKRDIRKNFEEHFSGILGQKGFRFDDIATVAKGRLGPAEEALLRDVEDLGWQGKVLPFDEGDIEDQNALVWVESLDGKPRTVVKMKVRPEADKKLQRFLKKSAPTTLETKLGEPLAEDEFAGDILLAAKTIRKHAQDHAFNQATIDKALSHLPALRDLAKSDDPDLRDMASGYIAWIEKIDTAAKSKTSFTD